MTTAPTTTIVPVHLDPRRRHDFVLLFDVRDGNPNGDPDAGNQPRVDPETMQGLVTDVSIKRKVRDYADIADSHGEGRGKIYVQRGEFLATQRERVFGEHGGNKKTDPDEARKWMCSEFFDVRMFGAVMSMTEHNAGQVRGPMQLTFARSVDPIIPLDSTITGPAQNQKDVNQADSADDTDAGRNKNTMGRKSMVPYGLYRAKGFFNPHYASDTGVDSDDLNLFWTALEMAWDHDRSAARGEMACRGLYIFTHTNRLGDAAAHCLLDLISVPTSTVDAPRSFSDYTVERPVDGPLEAFPAITLTTLVG